MVPLPSVADINVHDSLDERVAVRHFAGKTLDDAEALFRDHALRYQEDLMFMGPVAFRFYVPAFVNYLRSDAAFGDSDAVNCFLRLVRFRWEIGCREVEPVRGLLADACRFVAENQANDPVDEAIYGDVRVAAAALLSQLTATSADTPTADSGIRTPDHRRGDGGAIGSTVRPERI